MYLHTALGHLSHLSVVQYKKVNLKDQSVCLQCILSPPYLLALGVINLQCLNLHNILHVIDFKRYQADEMRIAELLAFNGLT